MAWFLGQIWLWMLVAFLIGSAAAYLLAMILIPSEKDFADHNGASTLERPS